MAEVFREHDYAVHLSDIATGTDFLEADLTKISDWIITNPPFSLLEKFIRHAWDLKVPFAFLTKATFWNAQRRLNLFYDCTPEFILPLTWRPDFTGQGASLLDMMWCVWTRSKVTQYIPLEKP